MGIKIAFVWDISELSIRLLTKSCFSYFKISSMVSDMALKLAFQLLLGQRQWLCNHFLAFDLIIKGTSNLFFFFIGLVKSIIYNENHFHKKAFLKKAISLTTHDTPPPYVIKSRLSFRWFHFIEKGSCMYEEVFFQNGGAFINHVDMAGGGRVAKYYYISPIK